MAKDKRRKLLESMGIDEETMFGNNESSKAEREFERIIEEAFKTGRIPSECIEEIPVSDTMMARCVIYKEC